MTVLANARVVTPEGIVDPGWIEIDGGLIVAVGAGSPVDRPERTRADRDLAGRTVVPGFVDIHVHGGGGAAYTSSDQEQIATVARFHRSHGTTTTMAGLISAAPKVLERQVAALSEVAGDGLIAGIHLEGPWLSPAKRGAHDPKALRPPAREEVATLLSLGQGAVRMVTIAPELEGGEDAVRQIVDGGAVAAIGHTDATYEQARRAIDLAGPAGAVATHLYNAMPSLHHREPGPVAALLEDPRVTVELVADGFHVHPSMLGLAIRAAGVDRVALVTDAMDAAGMPDGEYELGGLAVRVENGLVRLVEGSSIAGSTLTMDAALRYVVREVGVPLDQAARMVAANPARALGLNDVGEIRSGLRADLVVLDDDLTVEAVMVGGRWQEQH
ncbi:MAG TPA: N-acetylglucosamine-6-phosphate deacetylase [Actinopolymorphaceae bacterium]